MNIWHITKQILTYEVGQYRLYGSSATILTSALPQSMSLPQIHKSPHIPHHRSPFVQYDSLVIANYLHFGKSYCSQLCLMQCEFPKFKSFLYCASCNMNFPRANKFHTALIKVPYLIISYHIISYHIISFRCHIYCCEVQ